MLHEVLWLLEQILQEHVHLALLDLVKLVHGVLRTDDLVHEPAARAMTSTIGEEDRRTRPANEVTAKCHDGAVRVDSAPLVEEVHRNLGRVDDDHRLPEDRHRADVAWDS